MNNFSKIEQTNPILKSEYSNSSSMPCMKEIDEVQECLKKICGRDKADENSDDSLSPTEYYAKLQAEKQEFAAAMQILQNAYWYSLGLEDGDPYAIQQLRNMDIDGSEFLGSAYDYIVQDAIDIRQKALNNVQSDNGSINRQETYDLIANHHQDMKESEVKEIVDKISIS